MKLNIVSVYKLLKNRDDWECCDDLFPEYVHKVYNVRFFECEHGNCPTFLFNSNRTVVYVLPFLLYIFLDAIFSIKKPYKKPVNVLNLKTINRRLKERKGREMRKG